MPRNPNALCENYPYQHAVLLRSEIRESLQQFTQYNRTTRQIMRRYLRHDVEGKNIGDNTILSSEVQDLYNKTGQMLSSFALNGFACPYSISNSNTQSCRPHAVFMGAQSELLFDALVFSRVKARISDPMYCIPTSTIVDGLGFARNKEGERVGGNRGFDRWLVRRAHKNREKTISREPVKVQVKTADCATSPYDKDILVVSLEKLAGGKDNVSLLQRAVIDDSRGNNHFTPIVTAAYKRLVTEVNTHIDLQQPG